jgi:hypothetical protein
MKRVLNRILDGVFYIGIRKNYSYTFVCLFLYCNISGMNSPWNMLLIACKITGSKVVSGYWFVQKWFCFVQVRGNLWDKKRSLVKASF